MCIVKQGRYETTRATHRRPEAHNLPIGTLHYSCLQVLPANQPARRYLPRSNSVAAHSGFELFIDFSRSICAASIHIK